MPWHLRCDPGIDSCCHTRWRYIPGTREGCTSPSQVLQWMFAAAPGHPALRDICDHIAGSVDTQFSGDKNFDTLERTGPGAFTDVILKHAQLHPLFKAR